MELKDMKQLYFITAALALAVAGCNVYSEDAPVDDALRIVVSPSLQTFKANGMTADGQSEHRAVVQVFRGTSLSNEGWKAEIIDEPSWIDDFQASVKISDSFTDVYSGKTYETNHKGICLSLRSNKGTTRTAVLRITTDRGDYVEYKIRQRGEIPDDVHIGSLNDLKAWVADQEEWSDADNVFLEADIDMDGVEWEPINFSGKFDGQGHKIYNFVQTVSGKSFGFFGTMTGSLSNLTFGSKDGLTYDGVSEINFDAPASVSRCHVGMISICRGNVTGVVNFVNVNIAPTCEANVYSAPLIATVTMADIQIKDCINHGNLNAPLAEKTTAKETLLGGILARCEPGAGSAIDIVDCKNYGNVITQDPFSTSIGGILGNVPNGHLVRITGCENFGNVANNSTAAPEGFKEGYAGGIGGLLYGGANTGIVIKNCINHANLKASGTTLGDYGGILGRGRPAEITGCVNEGSITFEGDGKAQGLLIGGITGGMYQGGTITGCTNKGDITSNKNTVHRMGGITGTMSSGKVTVRDCTNEGNLSIIRTLTNSNWQGIGGICGYQEQSDEALIEGCANKGKVTIICPSTTTHVNAIGAGGIMGTCKLNMTMKNNTNLGDVTATIDGSVANYAGGLVGYMYAGSTSGDKVKCAVSCACAGILAGNNCGSFSGVSAGGSVNGTVINAGNVSSLAAGANTGSITGVSFWE